MFKLLKKDKHSDEKKRNGTKEREVLKHKEEMQGNTAKSKFASAFSVELPQILLEGE